ncbi:hypothetical protein [Ferruginibacter sp.]|nr:hypothetical protein [Ferruginibacter sp.]
MRISLKIFLLLLSCQMLCNIAAAQFVLSGTVFDSSKINFVPGVKVVNKLGNFTFTDSVGKYSLTVAEKDSVSFIFRNKSTQKFAVRTVADPSHFDISLRVNYKGKYSTLKEVVVFAKSYKEDSIDNRETYAAIYNYEKPGLKSSISPSGMVGADVNELINIFRFKRNKRLKTFQIRLENQEQEKYVNYRFNKTLIKRLTHLDGQQLDIFMVRYRPDYEFASMADELVMNQYILNCSYKYKIELLQQDVPKEKI